MTLHTRRWRQSLPVSLPPQLDLSTHPRTNLPLVEEALLLQHTYPVQAHHTDTHTHSVEQGRDPRGTTPTRPLAVALVKYHHSWGSKISLLVVK